MRSWLWVIVLLVVLPSFEATATIVPIGEDHPPAKHPPKKRPATPIIAPDPVKALFAPLRQEITSVEEPTPDTINRELGGSYKVPTLNTCSANRTGGFIHWTRFYDGVQLELVPITSKVGTTYITRFMPELAGPERPRRKKLIGEKKALQGGKMTSPATVTLFYMANLGVRRIRASATYNAADFIQVVESWRLTYRIEDQNRGMYIDAYTGELVRPWNNRN